MLIPRTLTYSRNLVRMIRSVETPTVRKRTIICPGTAAAAVGGRETVQWLLRVKRSNDCTTGGNEMKALALAILISCVAASGALAQSCEVKAVSKDGKPLSGAAKTSFVNKCKKDTCEAKAVSAEGKKLSGAAKNSFIKKCESEA
jgi:hypothetical protein